MRKYFKNLKQSMTNREEIKAKITLLKAQSHNEYKETLLMLRLLYKQAKTTEDKAFIRQQAVDLIKISIVIVIAALPAGTLVVAFMEFGFRKINRTILPTSFSEEFKNALKSRQQKE
jgi:Na+-transporting NADH:ubiquinone oxidoreductase subunit NqrB